MAKAGADRLGAIAQLGERLLCKQEVVGSIPSGSTSGEGNRRLKLRLECLSVNEPYGSSVNMNPRMHMCPPGRPCLRVLSDIVKRRSFRANVMAAGRYVLRAPKHMFDFGHHPSAGVAHVCQRSLTASLSVRSCEARIEVFLNQCLTGANASSYSVYIGRYISCRRDSPRIQTTNGRWMGIDNESKQV